MRNQPPAWVEPYVGLPFAPRGRGPAYDCWGLAVLVAGARFGVQLPSFAERYDDLKDHARLAALIDGHGGGALFDAVPAAAERAGDLVTARAHGLPVHIGIVVDPGWLLHATATHGSLCDRYRSPMSGLHILGFYRPAGLARAGHAA